MAKERLSKLQKWILEKSYKRISDDNPDGKITRWKLMDMGKLNLSGEVSMSRSLRNLMVKGYIDCLSSWWRLDVNSQINIYDKKIAEKMGVSPDDIWDWGNEEEKRKKLGWSKHQFRNIKAIQLTAKGKEIAKTLMLNSETDTELNNKET